MKTLLISGILLMFVLVGVGVARAQTSTDASGTTGGTSTTTPGVPNTAADPMANLLVLAASALAATGGILYLKKTSA